MFFRVSLIPRRILEPKRVYGLPSWTRRTQLDFVIFLPVKMAGNPICAGFLFTKFISQSASRKFSAAQMIDDRHFGELSVLFCAKKFDFSIAWQVICSFFSTNFRVKALQRTLKLLKKSFFGRSHMYFAKFLLSLSQKNRKKSWSAAH